MIAFFKRRWLWLLLPGGAVMLFVLWLHRRSQAAAIAGAAAASSAYNADPLAAAHAQAVRAVTYASAEADALRAQGLLGDPLAQALLGVSGAALAPTTDPATVAANQARQTELQSKLAKLQAQLADLQSAYAINHNGGQTPDQEAGIEHPIVSQITSLQAELATLGATT